MKFISGYYRQKEESTSLLLQQYVCRDMPVCLGCICGGENREAGMAGGLFTGRLLKEFREYGLLKAVGKPARFLEKMEKEICVCGDRCGLVPDFWTAGILCIGEVFLAFSMGRAGIALCNTGFGRPALCGIGEEDGEGRLRIRRGSMETGIGILLASESFYEGIPRADLQNCLAVREICDFTQTRKRIRELGDMAERRGGRGMCALLLEVKV